MKFNHYPVSFTDFLEAKKVGNYPKFYCILDDRIHMEMPIENATFVTCVFIESIKEKYGSDMTQDPVEMFVKTHLRDGLSFKYYPNVEEIELIKSYKYFQVFSATKLLKKSFDEDKLELIEDDGGLHLKDGEEIILSLKKEQ